MLQINYEFIPVEIYFSHIIGRQGMLNAIILFIQNIILQITDNILFIEKAIILNRKRNNTSFSVQNITKLR